MEYEFFKLKHNILNQVQDFVKSDASFKEFYTRTLSLLSDDDKSLKQLLVEIPLTGFSDIKSITYDLKTLDNYLRNSRSLKFKSCHRLDVDASLLYKSSFYGSAYDIQDFTTLDIDVHVVSSNDAPLYNNYELDFFKLEWLDKDEKIVITKHLALSLYALLESNDSIIRKCYNRLVSCTDDNDYSLRITIYNSMLHDSNLYDKLFSFLDYILDTAECKFTKYILDIYNLFPSKVYNNSNFVKCMSNDKYVLVFHYIKDFEYNMVLQDLAAIADKRDWSNIYLSLHNQYYAYNVLIDTTQLTSLEDIYGCKLVSEMDAVESSLGDS
jgi:hypothetical protein